VDVLLLSRNTPQKKSFIKHARKDSHVMLFIFIAWLLTLATLAIILRALHTIPIYTYTALEHDGQQIQLHTLLIMSKILLSLAFFMLMLHFILPPTTQEFQPRHAKTNSSLDTVNLSHGLPAHNFSW
jgi:hypothetical protein